MSKQTGFKNPHEQNWIFDHDESIKFAQLN